MNSVFQVISGSVTAPLGFRASGVHCGIKKAVEDKAEALDLALITSEVEGPIAGMFTTNQVHAAPIKLCLEHIQNRSGQAIVANSGNANACTSKVGNDDAKSMCEQVSKGLGMKSESVFVASTGRIGLPLPMSNIRIGIDQAISKLSSKPHGANAAAKAIMTSDTHPKEFAIEIPFSDFSERHIRIGGIAKGAGMIDPQMTENGRRSRKGNHATMLAFLTTDISIEAGLLQKALSDAVERSFNAATIDGDMSTNDTVLILSNGQAGNPTLQNANSSLYETFCQALFQTCLQLTKMMIRDAEGASRFICVNVFGARTDAEARSAARAVSRSLLVKTSWNGGDPNWGRIVDALGYSSAKIVEEKIDLAYSAHDSSERLYSIRGGAPTNVPFDRLCYEVARSEFDIHIQLNLGKGEAQIYTCDLTEAFVSFNKGDLSNPDSLGG